MSLSIYQLEHGCHVARLDCRRHRRAYAPASNTASHDNLEKVNPWVSFTGTSCMGMELCFAALWAAGALLLFTLCM